jgi:hypothetical protein
MNAQIEQLSTMDTDTAPEMDALDLGIEELDETVAPGAWEWVAGIGAGAVAGYGAVALGAAIT